MTAPSSGLHPREGRRKGWARARYLPVHLIRRFWWAVTAKPLGPDARGWVTGLLLPAELVLFDKMSPADQRHHVQVARRMAQRVGADIAREWLAAALLHDIGKLVCGLGTMARVFATFVPFMARGDGRIGRYYRHEAIGASLLIAARSDPVTISLVGHWPDSPAVAQLALMWADDL